MASHRPRTSETAAATESAIRIAPVPIRPTTVTTISAPAVSWSEPIATTGINPWIAPWIAPGIEAVSTKPVPRITPRVAKAITTTISTETVTVKAIAGTPVVKSITSSTIIKASKASWRSTWPVPRSITRPIAWSIPWPIPRSTVLARSRRAALMALHSPGKVDVRALHTGPISRLHDVRIRTSSHRAPSKTSWSVTVPAPSISEPSAPLFWAVSSKVTWLPAVVAVSVPTTTPFTMLPTMLPTPISATTVSVPASVPTMIPVPTRRRSQFLIASYWNFPLRRTRFGVIIVRVICLRISPSHPAMRQLWL
mmetsp:Transcript_30827/g.71094  ORF Transcript_30827/g.71094 Transcript_30827/m.71094 type:complete len:310 (-) Transcript_30827:19-948(-)